MKSFRRIYYLPPDRDKATKWVFKRLVNVSHDIAKNLEAYFPDLPYPKDNISDQAFGAFFGTTFCQLQIGSSALGHGKDKPCSMRHFATRAKYSNRHFFRVQAALVEHECLTSDHDNQGMPAKREYTPKFWAGVKSLLKKHLEPVPKDVKDQEQIERWIAQLIQKGRDYLAALALAKQRAEEKPLADPSVHAAAIRTMHEILGKHFSRGRARGRGGGDPAPAV